MSTYRLRGQIRTSLLDCLQRVEALRHELDVAFEAEKLGWERTSAQRRRKEDHVEDYLAAIDKAVVEMKLATEVLRGAGDPSNA